MPLYYEYHASGKNIDICVETIGDNKRHPIYQTSTNYVFSNKELIENITTYYRLCGLEHLSRTSNIKVSLPSIDTIFTENAILQLKLPPEMPNPCDWYN